MTPVLGETFEGVKTVDFAIWEDPRQGSRTRAFVNAEIQNLPIQLDGLICF